MKNRKNLLLGCMLIFVLLGGCQEQQSEVSAVVAPATQIKGLDLSKYQGKVDFQKIKAAGIRFVFIRATEGVTYQDVDYATNIAEARAAGLVVGAYHFYETNDDPSAQLENFKSIVTLGAGGLPPVVDIEKLHKQDKGHLSANLQRFLEGLTSHYGVKPIIYTGLNFSNHYLTNFGDYPLWLAEYEVEEPTLPGGWTEWTFWQWSQKGAAPGVNGYVDTDRFNGDEKHFTELLIK